jgi:hypothetical protein
MDEHAADLPWVYAIRYDELPGAAACFSSAARRRLPVEVVEPYLLLGDARSAADVAELQRLGVTHVFNCAGAAASAPCGPAAFAHAGIALAEVSGEDVEGYPMLELHLGALRAHCAAARAAQGRCLVHCVAGWNRSAVLACAELMIQGRVPVLQAVARVRSVRGRQALCNESFQEQLVRLARAEGLLGPAPGEPGGPTSVVPPRRPGQQRVQPSRAAKLLQR